MQLVIFIIPFSIPEGVLQKDLSQMPSIYYPYFVKKTLEVTQNQYHLSSYVAVASYRFYLWFCDDNEYSGIVEDMSLVKLCACLLNVSEAKNRSLVEQIARAGVVKNISQKDQDNYIDRYVKDSKSMNTNIDLEAGINDNEDAFKRARNILFGCQQNLQSAIFNIFSDPVYNRSVITIAGTLPGVEQGVTQACHEAFKTLPGNIFLTNFGVCFVLMFCFHNNQN